MNNHVEIKELVSAYFDGQATTQEKRLVEDHLLECASCQEYYRQLHKLSATLNEWTNEDLSPDLEQKIQRGLKEALMDREKAKKTKHPLFKVGVGGGGILAVILVLVLSMQVYNKGSFEGRIKSPTDNVGPQYVPKDDQIARAVQSAESDTLQRRASIDNKIAAAISPSQQLASQKQIDDLSKAEVVKDERNSRAPEKKLKESTYFQGGAPMNVPASQVAKRARRRELGGFQESSYGAYDLAAGYVRSDAVQPETNMLYPQIAGNTEQYDRIYENEFLTVKDNPLSTLSIDVDTASYSNMRRFLNSNQLPPPDAVRIEELINYFNYDYPNPTGEHPFTVTTKASVCPWNKAHQLVQIGVQGKTLNTDELLPSNLVFLIDVSGSMNQPDKLPLLKTAFKMMVNQLGDNERVAIVVYAGAAGKVLDSTPGSNKQAIIQAIDNLNAGGSTAGGAGIKLAYSIARENFIKEGNNRVILATDGDFNVGASSNAEMIRLIEEERKAGVFLTVVGFGTGNYKDSRMEQIADKGNGNYYYIDTQKEAKKVFVSELGSTLFTIAKDVKIQIEFNPSKIKAYKLIGYENRVLAKEDFNDDTKDAGELGAGHTVTALYEITPIDSKEEYGNVDEMVYQQTQVIQSKDLMTVKLRYKDPDADTSKLIKQVITESDITNEPAGDFQFAAAVAEFGLLLRNSKFKGDASYQDVLMQAKNAKGEDSYGYREEFINLVEKAQTLDVRVPEGPGIMFKN